MNNQKHILLILDSKNFGGIETHVYYLAAGLTKAGHQVSVIFIKKYGEHPLFVKLSQQNIPYTHLDGKLLSLIKIIRKEQPDLIHSHGYKANIFCKILKLLVNIPTVCSYHAGDVGVGKVKYYCLFDYYTAFITKNIAINYQVQKKIKGSAIIINNFINGEFLEKKSCNTGNSIGFIGRLSHEKGPDIFCKIAKSFPDTIFTAAGDGELKQQLEVIKPANIEILGYFDDISKYLKTLDVLCITSREEGLPFSLIEAMGSGVTVISFDVGSIKKVIKNGYNGFIVKKDSINDFIKTLKKYLDMKQCEKEKIKQNALTTINDHFTDSVIIPNILEFYGFQKV